ncbi:Glucanosyltransferase-domain-containing protein [Massariosphaeria phaeospora]|uniref:1,3-beta-glucanosyltransferase n=1 Tax=Massariosphaeria phaeospora TaxID=100035 RepID=A0A7C8I8G6_9PLEO|nr:Glucanosyltransferase-domain-containing protein [Massariosphaeria phaeospora]
MWRWLATYALCACQATLAIPTIEIKGSKFFTSDGDQFYIKGKYSSRLNGYQLTRFQCNIDAPLIKDLGANVVRVYSVDPTLNHDACMKAFEDAGIYVIVDMSTPTYSIKRNDPQWSFELRDAFADVIDVDSTTAAPYAKAVVADMKAYRDLMQYRKIPIGYSAADLANLYELQQDYFACGNDSVAADFFAFNKYSWCSPSSFTESGYDAIYKAVDGYDIPVFLSETGCTTNDRKWEDQVAVLGREMNDRFSGNIIYEWSENENGYGIANYSNGVATGTPKLMADYTRLQSQWATLSPTGVKASAYNPSLTKRACPASTSGVWNVRADDALPTLGTSGWTAPTTPRQTGSGSAAAAAASVTAVAKESTPPGPSTESSGVSSGAIAGGVVGVGGSRVMAGV